MSFIDTSALRPHIPTLAEHCPELLAQWRANLMGREKEFADFFDHHHAKHMEGKSNNTIDSAIDDAYAETGATRFLMNKLLRQCYDDASDRKDRDTDHLKDIQGSIMRIDAGMMFARLHIEDCLLAKEAERIERTTPGGFLHMPTAWRSKMNIPEGLKNERRFGVVKELLNHPEKLEAMRSEVATHFERVHEAIDALEETLKERGPLYGRIDDIGKKWAQQDYDAVMEHLLPLVRLQTNALHSIMLDLVKESPAEGVGTPGGERAERIRQQQTESRDKPRTPWG